MGELEELRTKLIEYVKTKFYSRPQIRELADDIVNQAFSEVLPNIDKCNFGYLAKACIHIAYRYFKRTDNEGKSILSFDDTLSFLDETDVVDELAESENTAEIFNSLDALKEIERVIVFQRYYGDFSFAEIARENSIKLNTVLSHHRRALEKLRPRLSALAGERIKQRRADKAPAGNFTKLF